MARTSKPRMRAPRVAPSACDLDAAYEVPTPEAVGMEFAQAQAELRRIQAQALLVETKARQLRGDLVAKALLTKEVSELAYAVRQRFRALPARVARELVGLTDYREIERRLLVAVDEALVVIARAEQNSSDAGPPKRRRSRRS